MHCIDGSDSNLFGTFHYLLEREYCLKTLKRYFTDYVTLKDVTEDVEQKVRPLATSCNQRDHRKLIAVERGLGAGGRKCDKQ